MGLITRIVDAIEDMMERVGRDKEDVWRSLKQASARAGELAISNLELEDENDRLQKRVHDLEEELDQLRFNGPSLYQDELAAVKWAARFAAKGGNPAASRSLCNLLFRVDQMPFTAEELEKLARAALDNAQRDAPPAFVGTVEEFERFINEGDSKLNPFDPAEGMDSKDDEFSDEQED